MSNRIKPSIAAERPLLVPCRGCMVSCVFITKCDGASWRMTDSVVATCLEQAGEKTKS